MMPVRSATYRDFGYDVDADWAKLPPDLHWNEVSGVATDSRDRVYLFNRGRQPIIILERDGTFVDAWGEGIFARAHGLTIGPDDALYCVDDLDHTVRRFTTDGEWVWTLGTSGVSSDTGATSVDYRGILRVGPPFHFPTNLAIAPSGEMYVGDGYGNARIHKFSAEGELLLSWGEPGAGPGQFRIPHGIAVDREGVVYVADRENSRIQLFTPDGDYLTSWTDVARPCQVFISESGEVYVAELGYRAGMWSGTTAPSDDATGGRVSIFDPQGALVARWGGGDHPCEPGDFFAPHDIWVDSRGDIYVAEVVMSAGGNRGLVSPSCHSLQKFTRLDHKSRIAS